jgi:ADP-ribose pyrophosphatase YjhB (NUDIX family)
VNFEPQKFFIGLLDFFSIWLPGALLTYLMMDVVGPHVIGDRYFTLRGAEAWMVFLFSAYLLGHFVFLIGSWLLDDRIYDRLRDATRGSVIRKLAKGEPLPWRVFRILARITFKRTIDDPVRHAAELKNRYLAGLGASSAINTFQWSKARLALDSPEALATVQRFEADSKFFRSLVVVLLVVLLIAMPFGVVASGWGPVVGGTALLLLAFWRYKDQRVKSTNQAYWYVLTLESRKPETSPGAVASGGPLQTVVARLFEKRASHAGGVVFRRVGGRVQYLLVQTRRTPHEWVLPRGHIERTESSRETAVREVREEGGVWAQVQSEIKTLAYGQVTVLVYLMEALEQRRPDEDRKRCWLPVYNAEKALKHAESRDVLFDGHRAVMALLESRDRAGRRTWVWRLRARARLMRLRARASTTPVRAGSDIAPPRAGATVRRKASPPG